MRLVLFALLIASVPALARAQNSAPTPNAPMPQCGPALDGQTMCRFGVVYACEYVSPDSTERHTGWRWKSDLLLSCESDPAPADLPGGNQGGLPPGFTYAPQSAPQSPPWGAVQGGDPQMAPAQRPYGRGD